MKSLKLIIVSALLAFGGLAPLAHATVSIETALEYGNCTITVLSPILFAPGENKVKVGRVEVLARQISPILTRILQPGRTLLLDREYPERCTYVEGILMIRDASIATIDFSDHVDIDSFNAAAAGFLKLECDAVGLQENF